ncbi:Hypothetical protein CINCED_3A022620 [Cinara cedri]|uniref:Uncharacterized protein n=1 Tax=Cinara cedri TaxID=506608 RepID=A0A5E4MPD7_9HEMI|nr:Hypothetical protein CINCED_3A022620 [Cinara cedri]
MRGFNIILIVMINLQFTILVFARLEKYQQSKKLLKIISKTPCWSQNTQILWKKVIIQGKKIAINDILKEGDWQITEQNVCEVSNLLSTVLSCEYAELNLNYIAVYLNTYLRNYEAKGSEDKNVYTLLYRIRILKESSNSLELLKSSVSEMISTLVSYIGNVENHCVSTKHEYLLMLLNWYLHLNQFVNMFSTIIETNKDTISRLLTHYTEQDAYNCDKVKEDELNKVLKDYVHNLIVIGFQVESNFKAYHAKTCARKFDLIRLPELNPMYLSTQYEKLKQKYLMYISTITSTSNGVLDVHKKHGMLVHGIQNNTNIIIKWDHDEYLSLMDIYEQYIKNCNNLVNLLKYEKLILNIMIDLVQSKVVSELEYLFKNKQTNLCKSITSALNTFMKLLNNFPRLFIDNMTKMIFRINTIISYIAMEDTEKNVEELLNKMKSEIRIDFPYDKIWRIPKSEIEIKTLFGFLYQVISNLGKYTYLNSEILNILCGKSYIFISNWSEYAVDYKILYHFRNNRISFDSDKCSALYNTTALAHNVLQVSMDGFTQKTIVKERKVSEENIFSFDVLGDFNKKTLKLKEQFIHFYALKCENNNITYGDSDYCLLKKLFALIYNMANSKLYSDVFQKSCVEENVQYLISFYSDLAWLLEKYYFLLCDNKSIHTFDGILQKESGEMNIGHDIVIEDLLKITNIFYNTPAQQKTNYENPTDSYYSVDGKTLFVEHSFGVLIRYKEFITHNAERFRGENIKFYSNGTQKSIIGFETESTESILEIHDIVEFQYITVKWIICVFVFDLILILEVFQENSSIDFDVEPFFSELEPISDLPDHFINFRFLRHSIPVIKEILLNNLDKSSIDSVIKFLTGELENFDVVIPSLSKNYKYEADVELLLNKITTDVKMAHSSGFQFMIGFLGLGDLFKGKQKSYMTDCNFYIDQSVPENINS